MNSFSEKITRKNALFHFFPFNGKKSSQARLKNIFRYFIRFGRLFGRNSFILKFKQENVSKWKIQATVDSVVATVKSVITVNSVAAFSDEQKATLLTMDSFVLSSHDPNRPLNVTS